MIGQEKIQHLLQSTLLEARKVNPAYSMRALAKKIGLRPSATNEILKGERRVSKKVLERIMHHLALDPSQKSELLKNFPNKIKRNRQDCKSADKEKAALKLSHNQFDLISDWVHFAILSLLETKNFSSDIEWMAEKLDITTSRVKKALRNLITLNLVRFNNENKFESIYENVNTTDDIFSLSILKSHMTDIENLKEKLTNVDIKLRDFTSFTLAVDIALLDEAKIIIRKAQDEIDALMKTGEKTEVYKMNMYLYPLTKQNLGNMK